MTPPRISTWFLTHFSCAHDTESLLGDLAEELSRGRSRNWYRKQVLVAIIASAWTTIASHKALTIRALLVGWTFLVVSIASVAWLARTYRAGRRVFTSLGRALRGFKRFRRRVMWTAFSILWLDRRPHSSTARTRDAVRLASVMIFCEPACDVAATVNLRKLCRCTRRSSHASSLLNALKNPIFLSMLILLGGLWVRQPVVPIDTQTSAE